MPRYDASMARFIYYPDRLTALPSGRVRLGPLVLRMLREPVYAGFLPGLAREYFAARRGADVRDETMGDFIARRMDRRVADNIVSAAYHGIYGGDIWRLSMKSVRPDVWAMEHSYGGYLKAALRMRHDVDGPAVMAHPYDRELLARFRAQNTLDPAFVEKLDHSAVYSLDDGMGQLAHALETSLKQNPRVTIKQNSAMKAANYRDGRVDVVTEVRPPVCETRVPTPTSDAGQREPELRLGHQHDGSAGRRDRRARVHQDRHVLVAGSRAAAGARLRLPDSAERAV